ncbi:Histone deacetylase complex subunit SAP18 [Zea mays]|uniref:Histone deacetylase complex subunit SAP18 n=1 Tax=Zea mays TaxID=4577 RepID=A0A3L6EJ35_MAIZE|nr:Histone deacetylase complex subunit SAP18 [Zea mays]
MEEATSKVDHAPKGKEDAAPASVMDVDAVELEVAGHHQNEEFAVRGKKPKDEVQIYTWKDATLHELTDLVGSTFAYGHGRGDDAKTLAELGFQIGDYLSVAIM